MNRLRVYEMKSLRNDPVRRVPEMKTMRIHNHTNDSNLTTKQNEKKKSVRVKL